MGRHLSKDAKHRRQYVIVCYDPVFKKTKYFQRSGYKALLLSQYAKDYPDYDVSIYVLSGSVLSDIRQYL